MKVIRNILVCALLAVLIAAVVYGIMFIRAATAVVSAVPGQVGEAQASLMREVQATRQDLIGQVAAVRRDASSQLTDLQTNVFAQVAETREVLDRRVGDSLARVDTALGTVDALRADLQPALANVRDITAHADEASAILLRRDALPAQVLGVLGGAKVTLGQTAETMRDIQRATPALLETVQKVGSNSDAATAKTVQAAEESRRLLFNLAENTTPLPKWLRYPLQVVGLVGTAAVPVITVEKLASK